MVSILIPIHISMVAVRSLPCKVVFRVSMMHIHSYMYVYTLSKNSITIMCLALRRSAITQVHTYVHKCAHACSIGMQQYEKTQLHIYVLLLRTHMHAYMIGVSLSEPHIDILCIYVCTVYLSISVTIVNDKIQ